VVTLRAPTSDPLINRLVLPPLFRLSDAFLHCWGHYRARLLDQYFGLTIMLLNGEVLFVLFWAIVVVVKCAETDCNLTQSKVPVL